ncbi:MAG: helix-turn-helix transcriptional regulator [Candidatus Marinimicrobia bacterium]|nr:helix-turn-helix transcriptional regulator [Candidatus Neomarinimicrobiota bacterium]
MGARLRVIREYLGDTQTTFAARFGRNRHDVANYERGRTDLPSSVIGVLDKLGFNITWLVTGEGYLLKMDDLLSRFKTLSNEFEKLSVDYRMEYDDLLRALAKAEHKRDSQGRS